MNAKNSGMPVRMCREKYHQCGVRSRATVSPSLMSCFGYGMRRTLGRRAGQRAEDAVEIRVAEPAVRIEPRAYGLEAVPLRVARRERRRGLEVHLAPVRTATELVHDRLDAAE